MRVPPRLRTIAAVLAAALVAVCTAGAASRPAVRGARGMVVAPEPRSAEVGREVLRRGGSAADAAVATAFVLSVTYPRAGALGAGGFALLRSGDGRYQGLDFREIAPAELRPEMFFDATGRPVPERALRGGLAVGVPGLVAGLAEIHARWGTRPWAELIAPAIELADRGYPLSAPSARRLREASDKLARDPEGMTVFFRDGRPLGEGDRLVQSDLARTLRIVAERGPRGFYEGPVAEAIVAAVRRAGGVVSAEDLASYRPVDREPIGRTYRGHRIVSFPPPSSGGVALLQMLGLLERFDLRGSGFGSSLTVHRIAEAERRAFADRTRWLGDPAFFPVPVDGLLDPAYLDGRAAGIRDDLATPSARLGPGQPRAREPSETLHLSVADARGRAVAATITLNSWFGSGIVADGTGVLLNNEIDDFALAPETANQFGLLGGTANAVAPGKRPLSSMTPTMVERPGGGARPLLVLGSPGGPTIITTVLQVIVNVIDHGMALQEAVDAPRFHHQWRPDRIEHEPRAFPADVVEALRARGHVLHPRESIGNVAAIGTDPEDGVWLGAADPRDEAAALGY